MTPVCVIHTPPYPPRCALQARGAGYLYGTQPQRRAEARRPDAPATCDAGRAGELRQVKPALSPQRAAEPGNCRNVDENRRPNGRQNGVSEHGSYEHDDTDDRQALAAAAVAERIGGGVGVVRKDALELDGPARADTVCANRQGCAICPGRPVGMG